MALAVVKRGADDAGHVVGALGRRPDKEGAAAVALARVAHRAELARAQLPLAQLVAEAGGERAHRDRRLLQRAVPDRVGRCLCVALPDKQTKETFSFAA